ARPGRVPGRRGRTVLDRADDRRPPRGVRGRRRAPRPVDGRRLAPGRSPRALDMHVDGAPVAVSPSWHDDLECFSALAAWSGHRPPEGPVPPRSRVVFTLVCLAALVALSACGHSAHPSAPAVPGANA